jgi:hypothetical protein
VAFWGKGRWRLGRIGEEKRSVELAGRASEVLTMHGQPGRCQASSVRLENVVFNLAGWEGPLREPHRSTALRLDEMAAYEIGL